MNSISCFAASWGIASCLLFLGSQSGPVLTSSDREEMLRAAQFFRIVAPDVEQFVARFPGQDETAVTYRRAGQPDLRVHFPARPAGNCGVGVWFVPQGAPILYEQLDEMAYANVSPADAVKRLKVSEDTRAIPCGSTLAVLLALSSDLLGPAVFDDVASAAVYFDTPETTLYARRGDMEITVSFPSSLRHPLAQWASEVELAVRAYITRGFRP